MVIQVLKQWLGAKKEFYNLELHVANICNLSCESCSHYSNQKHQGILSLADAEDWMRLWHHRLRPEVFSLLGGEPTIHPELARFVSLSQKYWPDSHLRLVTNGFFLHRHPGLPMALQKHPSAALYISIHHDGPEYQEKLRPVRELVAGWIRDYGIEVKYHESYQGWTRRYKGYGSAMEPFADENPRRSWENCPARFCKQLFEGKIWKCAPLAYLGIQNATHPLSEKWKPYLQYQPLPPDCSNRLLNEFFEREEESACGMCAANPEKFKKPVPFRSQISGATAGYA